MDAIGMTDGRTVDDETRRAILAIDPGSEQSAWLGLVDGLPVAFGIEPNPRLLILLREDVLTRQLCGTIGTTIVIEEIRSFMQRVGREVFDTVRWAGRFEEAARPTPVALLGRKDVVGHLCGSARGNDADVHAALIDHFGGAGGKAAAVGLKASPGPLYGISRDVWSALAIAVTYAEGRR